MRKKTKLLTAAVFTALVMLLSCTFTGVLAFADDGETPQPPTAEVTEADSVEWAKKSKNATVKYNPETGVYHVDNIIAWGDKAIYDRAVKLEGLKITFDFDSGSYNNRAFGFGFTDLSGEAYPWMAANAFCATIWPTMNGAVATQSRIFMSNQHDMTQGTIAYCDKQLSQPSGAITHDGTLVSDLGRVAFTMQFNAEPESTVWKVTVTRIAGVWANEGTEFYVSENYFKSVMNADGEAYVAVTGFSNDGATKNSAYITIEDENMVAATAAAEAAKTAYSNAIDAVTDADTFAASIAKREEFVTAVADLREFEKGAYNEELSALDAKYTQNDGVQAQVKATVTVKTDLTAAKVTALATESNITAEAITAAKADSAAAKEALDTAEDMLTQANKTELTALIAAHDAAIAVAEAKIWVISFEQRVNALEALEKDAVAAEAAKVDRYRDKYAGSESETLITALPDADKAALEARIAAADKKLADIKEEAAKPDKPTDPDNPQEPADPGESTDKTEKSTKCGGNIAASGVIAAFALFAACAVIMSLKKRKTTDK